MKAEWSLLSVIILNHLVCYKNIIKNQDQILSFLKIVLQKMWNSFDFPAKTNTET